MGENQFASAPVALYGLVLLMAAVAYAVLQRAIVSVESDESVLREATKGGLKEVVSTAMYVASIPLAFWRPWASGVLFVAVALIWLVPDRRIERAEAAVARRRGSPPG
jgi:uncharacterized membrane protein